MSETIDEAAPQGPPETTEGPPIDAGVAAVRTETLALQKRLGLTQTVIARESGLNPKTLNAFLNVTYQGRNDTIAADLRRWLDGRAAAARTKAAMPAAPAFLATPMSDECWRIFEHAQHMPDMAVIAGDAGTGKTMAIEAYAGSRSSVWVVTCEPTMVSIPSMLDGIATSMNMRRETSAMDTSKRVVQRVIGSGGLLIMDEAQHLRNPSLDQLRTIHDVGGIGIALVGNKQVYGRFDGPQRTPEFAQLFSRIGARLMRDKPSASDVGVLLDAWRVEDERQRALLGAIAGRPGALRGMTKTLRLAHLMAIGDGGGLSDAHIQRAARSLGIDESHRRRGTA